MMLSINYSFFIVKFISFCGSADCHKHAPQIARTNFDTNTINYEREIYILVAKVYIKL